MCSEKCHYQSTSLNIESCSAIQSSGVCILYDIFALSANKSILQSQGGVMFEIVLIKILNNSGERCPPWGTPDWTRGCLNVIRYIIKQINKLKSITEV